ncbi:hypothetical protein ASE00_12935 [Sphingomonas sp. Root710]|uniref:hypothetical protein n=1 Tax=Sphingomonas sp. Root710 TaxID=1736594 RepID=UPI0006F7CD09|nr:hypothetical protein [Sphingomonas sp. Root710]KRB82902.1 hypothetical protein ASE00_12935 [Sphingomonas sp. Root710]
MIYLGAIILLALSAILIRLIVLLMDSGRLQRSRTLILLILLSLLPAVAGIALLFTRHLIFQHP